jgi:hypothetical protein
MLGAGTICAFVWYCCEGAQRPRNDRKAQLVAACSTALGENVREFDIPGVADEKKPCYFRHFGETIGLVNGSCLA